MGYLADRMKFGVRSCPRVLLGNVCSELHVLADGATEWLVGGHTGIVERLQVAPDESLALLVGDLQVTVHLDDVPKTEPFGESRRAAE